MTNLRKQMSAKAAWARLAESNRRLRETLERIAASADPRTSEDAVRRLRELRQEARAALAANVRHNRAA